MKFDQFNLNMIIIRFVHVLLQKNTVHACSALARRQGVGKQGGRCVCCVFCVIHVCFLSVSCVFSAALIQDTEIQTKKQKSRKLVFSMFHAIPSKTSFGYIDTDRDKLHNAIGHVFTKTQDSQVNN